MYRNGLLTGVEKGWKAVHKVGRIYVLPCLSSDSAAGERKKQIEEGEGVQTEQILSTQLHTIVNFIPPLPYIMLVLFQSGLLYS
ncbi:hypothetical protein PRUPE_4G055700 [Prunus persica]|uniref:Uncharacterized protein n=1 Tax=Prunus persica TaxID=3760 RepID=A0A251PG77_PRUPE|nr:hypothetical protein PRUPE_4G055700 [Prunus persica]